MFRSSELQLQLQPIIKLRSITCFRLNGLKYTFGQTLYGHTQISKDQQQVYVRTYNLYNFYTSVFFILHQRITRRRKRDNNISNAYTMHLWTETTTACSAVIRSYLSKALSLSLSLSLSPPLNDGRKSPCPWQVRNKTEKKTKKKTPKTPAIRSTTRRAAPVQDSKH